MAQFAQALGKPLMPWQQHVADVALEIDPVTGRLAYRRVILTVPRQSGKTTLLLSLFAHRAMGFAEPQVMTYAAQTGVDARRKFIDEHVPMLERSVLSPLFNTRFTNGHEAVMWDNGSRHHISAGTEKSGHGATLDLAAVDEAFAQPDGRLEQAFSPAMITRPEPQLWFISTAGTPQHTWFRQKIDAGRLAVDSGAVAYFEWSAEDHADPGDPDVWRACMPALGHTVTEQVIAAEFLSMPLDEFRRAYLNQWVTAAAVSAVDPSAWAVLAEPAAARGAPSSVTLDVAADQSTASLAVSWVDAQGVTQVQLADHRPGTGWVAGKAADLGMTVRLAKSGTAAFLLADLERAGVTVETFDGAFYAAACGSFLAAVSAGTVHHGNQRPLNDAVEVSRLGPSGESGVRVISRKDPLVSPLVAAACAAHIAAAAPAPEPRIRWF